MRKSIWIPCILVLVFCCILLLKTKQTPKVSAPKQNETLLTNLPPPVTQPLVKDNHQNVRVPPPEASTNIIFVETAPGKSNAVNAWLLSQWQGSINFYGKVVDENTNPVSGADIHFSWQEIPAEDAMKTFDTTSDGAGLFSLQDARGWTLGVSVSKQGYYGSRKDNDSFRYGSLGGGTFSPDPQNPVVFHLRKKVAPESLVALKRNYAIPRDGTPVSVDLSTGVASTSENGNFVVRCWTQNPGQSSGGKFDWHCIVTIPGGGAVTNDDEFAFEAPETGYTPSLEISMPADRPNWQDDVDLKFYYRLADGRYGRMKFTMVAFGHHFCMIDSVLNPTGLRNLEPP